MHSQATPYVCDIIINRTAAMAEKWADGKSKFSLSLQLLDQVVFPELRSGGLIGLSTYGDDRRVTRVMVPQIDSGITPAAGRPTIPEPKGDGMLADALVSSISELARFPFGSRHVIAVIDAATLAAEDYEQTLSRLTRSVSYDRSLSSFYLICVGQATDNEKQKLSRLAAQGNGLATFFDVTPTPAAITTAVRKFCGEIIRDIREKQTFLFGRSHTGGGGTVEPLQKAFDIIDRQMHFVNQNVWGEVRGHADRNANIMQRQFDDARKKLDIAFLGMCASMLLIVAICVFLIFFFSPQSSSQMIGSRMPAGMNNDIDSIRGDVNILRDALEKLDERTKTKR